MPTEKLPFQLNSRLFGSKLPFGLFLNTLTLKDTFSAIVQEHWWKAGFSEKWLFSHFLPMLLESATDGALSAFWGGILENWRKGVWEHNFLIRQLFTIFFFLNNGWKGTFLPLVKTTDHAQPNLRQTEHVQWTSTKRRLKWHFRVLFNRSKMAQMEAMGQKEDFSAENALFSVHTTSWNSGPGPAPTIEKI